MFIGEYNHTIDTKNRLSLPFKFRKELGKKVIITPGLDSCLFIFTSKEWEKVSTQLSDSGQGLSFLKADQRTFNRNIFGQASEVEVDSIGRILIPEILKNKIGIKNSAALVGVKDRVEVWNEKVWKEVSARGAKEAEQLAEKISNERQK